MRGNWIEGNESKLWESKYFCLHGITELLGSQPADPEIRSTYIASKAPTAEIEEEENAANVYENEDRKGVSVFLRDKDHDGELFIYSYTIKGFFKSAFKALGDKLKVAGYKGKVDLQIDVKPNMLYIMRGDESAFEEEDYWERPLRTSGPTGERSALAASEYVNAPWEIYMEIRLIPISGGAKSKALDWECVYEALNYGEQNGLGQWRNSGKGQFRWEEIEKLPDGIGRDTGRRIKSA